MVDKEPDLRFVTSNHYKVAEAEKILMGRGISVVSSALKIEELQTTDTERLVRDKVLKAFRKIGRTLFVEHTGLYLEHLNGFPGGLTQIFWDSLLADRFSELFGSLAPNRNVTAKTWIGFCDGRTIKTFTGEISGLIAESPRGDRGFQWDCVFQPNGSTETFAEMGERKNDISMRRAALDKLALHLADRGTE